MELEEAATRALRIFKGAAHIEIFGDGDEREVIYVDSDSEAIVVRTRFNGGTADVLTVLDEDRDGKFAVHLLGSDGLVDGRAGQLRGSKRLPLERPSPVSERRVHMVAVARGSDDGEIHRGALATIGDDDLKVMLNRHYARGQ